MNPGLAQGFVRFGTVAHRILLAMHEHGDMRHSELVEELDVPTGNVGMNLTRLARYRFIWPAGKVSKYETGAAKTEMLFSLVHRRCIDQKYEPASGPEKQKYYRDARRKRVASVWEFRP